MGPFTGRAARWYRVATIGSLALPALLYAVVAWLTWDRAQDEAGERLERAGRIVQEHAARVVDANEVIARAVLDATAGLDEAQVAARQAALHAQLARLARGLPQLHSLWIWGAEGRPLVSSRFYPAPAFSVADRGYFIAARDGPADAWVVSRPLVSRANGEAFFNFSRRREDRAGRFAGAVSVSLHPGYFEAFYRDLARREPGLVVSLMRADGAVVASTAPGAPTEVDAADPLLRAIRAGEHAGELSLAGREFPAAPGAARRADGRLAFRQVGRLPLFAVVSLDEASILRGWRRELAVLAAFAFPLALGLAAASELGRRNARRLADALDAFHDQAGQRERAEAALRQAQKLEALGHITGGVAHDFNNVLMVVQSANALARRQSALGQDPQGALAAVDRAVKTGTQLTRQLLAFARRQPLQARVVSLQALVPPLVSLVQTTVGGAIRVEGRVDDDVAPVRVDVAEFELAVINLAVNARDAMPGGGSLRLRVRAGDDDDDGDRGGGAGNANPHGDAERGGPVPARAASRWVLVEVSDSGQGIAPELQERVFEPFFTTKPPGAGTGLGLAQVYGFATQAGGGVRLDSAPGRGTTVTLRLPACDEAAVSDGAAAAALPALSGRLLLVEDNDEVAAALSPLLRQLGLDVTHCRGAAAALAQLEAPGAVVDVVLSDIVMPGERGGLELAAELARTRPRLPVVLMSGYTPQLQRALDSGLTVCPKPCTPAALAAALAGALKQSRSTAGSRI